MLLVHLVPVLLLALLAAVGDLVAPSAPLQGADLWVHLLPVEDFAIRAAVAKEIRTRFRRHQHKNFPENLTLLTFGLFFKFFASN